MREGKRRSSCRCNMVVQKLERKLGQCGEKLKWNHRREEGGAETYEGDGTSLYCKLSR